MAIVGKPNHAQVVNTDDNNDLPWPSTYVSFNDATGGPSVGTIAIDTIGGEVNVTLSLPAGMYPICATRIYSTNTTVTNIVEYWDT